MQKKLCVFLFYFLLLGSLDAVERYQLINLGLLKYRTSEATSINQIGQICGTCQNKSKKYVFIWDPSGPLLNYSRIQSSSKPLINDKSEIFGSQLLPATDEVWDYEQEAIFCWKNPLSFFTFLNINGLGYPKEAAKRTPFDQKRAVLWDINDQGEMILMSSDCLKDFFLGNPRGFKYQVWLYQKRQYKLITHPQFSIGFSLNNQSKILGYYYGEKDSFRQDQKICTAIYNIKTKTVCPLEAPPNAIGKAINDLDQIIGIFHHPLTYAVQGFFSQPSGDFVVLENFSPFKANHKNLIVGKFLEGERKDKPAIWDNGRLYDLSELVDLIDDQENVWDSLDELVDLNDEGWIIGQGKFKGMSHGFLLRPIH